MKGTGPAATKPQAGPLHLTPRERQILVLLTEGLTYKQVGAELGISRYSVKNRVSDVRLRYGAATTVHLFTLIGWLEVR